MISRVLISVLTIGKYPNVSACAWKKKMLLVYPYLKVMLLCHCFIFRIDKIKSAHFFIKMLESISGSFKTSLDTLCPPIQGLINRRSNIINHLWCIHVTLEIGKTSLLDGKALLNSNLGFNQYLFIYLISVSFNIVYWNQKSLFQKHQ